MLEEIAVVRSLTLVPDLTGGVMSAPHGRRGAVAAAGLLPDGRGRASLGRLRGHPAAV